MKKTCIQYKKKNNTYTSTKTIRKHSTIRKLKKIRLKIALKSMKVRNIATPTR